jgi:dGTP triphosphohydrolase
MFKRKPGWRAEEDKYADALGAIIGEFPFAPEERYTDSDEDRARLYSFATGLIRYFVGSFRIRPKEANATSFVQIESEARREAEVLKQFIWEYIIENPELAVPQSGQRTAVKTVFDRLLQASTKRKHYLFPPAYHAPIATARTKAERVRLVADCISGMTEKELMHFYRGLGGIPI